MTTLRSFQAEIEQFSAEKHRLQVKEAREAHAAAELARHHGRKKEAAVVEEAKDKDEGDIEEIPIEDVVASEEHADEIGSRLATALLRGHGELVLAMGAHPSPSSLLASASPAGAAPAAAPESTESIGIPLSPAGLSAAIDRLRAACDAMKAELVELYRVEEGEKAYGCWMVRLTPRGVEEVIEVRVAVVGNVDAGKSTTLGVLTRGGLDDGRGKARVALFRHPHEIETGRTSSVGGEILGFSPTGQPVVPNTHIDSSDPHQHGLAAAKREKLGWEDICRRAAKVISFIDLAGHERYFKTTLYGLSGCAPDYVMLMVGGNAGLIGMSKEHLGVALALNVPIIVCVTKIDMTPPNILEQTLSMLVKVLRSPGCRRVPVFVDTPQQAVDCARHIGRVVGPNGARICPIFRVSNVTGHNLPQLLTLLNALPSGQTEDKFVVDAPFEFQISDVFSVPFVGTVVSGVITSGVVRANDAVLLGPDSVGQFMPTAIKTIQRKRAPVESAEAGQSVSFALKRIRRNQVRKGMVLVGKTETAPKAVKRFEGNVMVLHHSSTIQKNYQAMAHCGAVRQTVRIIGLDHPSGLIRTGDRARVEFEFINHSEYLKEGQLILLREAKTKVLGVVTKILG
ncbi:hypothetical protein Q5752_004556 [Cryptotrichosporon argae]